MTNYFSVGEEVILCSVEYPHLNGEYIVDRIVVCGESMTCRASGKSLFWEYKEAGYVLSGSGNDITCDSRGYEIGWTQSALRKKHKGSGKSFDQIVKSLHPTGATS